MKQEHLEMILEDINGKFDLILEGHDGLRSELRELSRRTDERFDVVDFKFDVLNKKVDKVAADLKATDARLSNKIDDVAAELKAHRVDTEVHRGYQLRED
jgi:hypothetical protein